MAHKMLADDRGAVMLVAVFMAVFGVAMVYYVVGIAEAVMYRQYLQDSVDAGSLSSAIMFARGMNLIVLLNLIMAGLLSILVMLRAVEGVAIVGMVIAVAMAWFTGGATLAAVGPFEMIRSQVNSIYGVLQPVVFSALEVLHDAADGVTKAAPAIAVASFESEVVRSDAGQRKLVAVNGIQVTAGIEPVFWPARIDLPVEDDSFGELCGQAGAVAADLVMKPLRQIPAVDKLEIDGVAREFTKMMKAWFCEDSGTAAPQMTHTVERSYPRLPTDQACEEYRSSGDDALSDALSFSGDASASVDADGGGASLAGDVSALGQAFANVEMPGPCAESQAQREQAAPAKRTGDCRPETNCSRDGPYQKLAALARAQCNPEKFSSNVSYTYQKRIGEVTYRRVEGIWVRLEPTYEEPVLVMPDGSGDKMEPPCLNKGRVQKWAGGYNTTVYATDDPTRFLPACTTERRPSSDSRRSQGLAVDGEEAKVRFEEVTHIFGCTRKEEIVISPKGEPVGDGSTSRAPKKLADGVQMGGADFQVRGIVLSEKTHSISQNAIHLARWGRAQKTEGLELIKGAGKFGFAQSEYFANKPDERNRWMWLMNYRGRLRRFRPLLDAQSFETACELQSPEIMKCEDIFEFLQRYRALFAH